MQIINKQILIRDRFYSGARRETNRHVFLCQFAVFIAQYTQWVQTLTAALLICQKVTKPVNRILKKCDFSTDGYESRQPMTWHLDRRVTI